MPSAPPAIELSGLTRRFGDVAALDGVSLQIASGEFFSLLGPSGCGKTTLLRIIAGLEVADAGRVRIAGQDATEVPAHHRPVNTVFQSYALFPHLDVWNNIAFGLRMKKRPKDEIAARVDKALALVQIESLGRRRPQQLSGGQKQRVALARAIVNEPAVLLLDEPLAALDLKLRKQLQLELRSLQRSLGMTFVYVTHDQEEALVLSDRIAVMRNGRIEQLGPARDLYERPRTRFASQFLGSCSLIEGRLENGVDGMVETRLGRLCLGRAAPARERVTLAIRPERIQLRALPADGAAGNVTPGPNVVPVRVAEVIYVGAESHYELRAGDQLLRCEKMNNEGADFQPGQAAWAYLPPAALIILDD